MNNITLKQLIEGKLIAEFQPNTLEIIDETDKHRKHKSFQPGKSHFKIIIQSEKLERFTKIKAHQAIYQCLDEWMQSDIHALSIKIITRP